MNEVYLWTRRFVGYNSRCKQVLPSLLTTSCCNQTSSLACNCLACSNLKAQLLIDNIRMVDGGSRAPGY
jgi:hypothetical protein